jgi:protein-tyrosine phosphatase
LHTAADRAIWFPLHDMHAPSLDDVQPLFAEIARRLDEDEGVIVHCGAGVGRAGTVAAALLMRRGLSLDDALATVASSRPMAGPQTLAQALFLEQLAASG